MNTTLKLYCVNNKTTYELPVGISLREALEKIDVNFGHPIVSAKVNQVNRGLNYRIYGPKDVEYLSAVDPSGMRAYTRSLYFIIYKAMKDLFQDGEFVLKYPVAGGVFCYIRRNGRLINAEELAQLPKRMHEIVDADIPFERFDCKREEAIELFKEKGMIDKVHLLETNQSLYMHYYKLGEEVDYYYGCLVPSTKLIQVFDLHFYDNGILILGPDKSDPSKLREEGSGLKVLHAFQEFEAFNKKFELNTVGAINHAINAGHASDIIKATEALQERKLAAIADEIVSRDKVKIVLISGPSSSGKTTFSKRLQVQLWTLLRNTLTLSMDNYFVDRDHTPLDENGEPDYESIHAVDLDLFGKQVAEILKGEEVEIPRYDFDKGKKVFEGKKVRLRKNDLMVIEGIHGLNPELLKNIPSENKYHIYVSALTTLCLDDHNCITTSDNRLIRRIIRDAKYRGYPVKRTLEWWPTVKKGEDKWIFPFQENADVVFNSALPYELSILKQQVIPHLETVPCDCPEYSEAKRLHHFLSYFTPILNEEIPPTSLLREFFGGSSFRYY